jgi:hypothetical protein
MRVLHGDARTILPTLASDSVQCVVTSPPYYGLRDYGVAGQIGLEPSPTDFVMALVEVFREVRRVLRPDGTLWLNLGDSYNAKPSGVRYDNAAGFRNGTAYTSDTSKQGWDSGLAAKQLLMMPARVALALQADGWWLRSDIIWSKPNPMPESVTDRPTSAHEHVFLLTKSARYYWDADAVRDPANCPEGSWGRSNKTYYDGCYSGRIGNGGATMPFDCLPDGLVSDLIKLRIARDGIAAKGGWAKYELGLQDQPAHCVIGWLLSATEWDERQATRLLVDYVYPALPETAKRGSRVAAVYEFNDRRPKSEIVKLLDNAVRLAETA